MAKIKLLIVEDENIVALDLKRRLVKMGYDVIGMASNANKALQVARDKSPDIVLMDIHIKGSTDGIETAKAVHEKYRIPVIFVTAYSEDATLSRARESMPYGYLLKPFSEREIHAAIQVAIERSQFDERLRKSETHLQLALNAANLNTWEIRNDSGPVILDYAPGKKLTEVTDWDLLIESIVPGDRNEVSDNVDRLQSSKIDQLAMEFEVHDPDRGRRWFALYGKSYKSVHLPSRHVVGIIQDITERRMVEESLKQAAMVYRCSADGIVILDKERMVVSANDAFERITGFGSPNIIGQELALLSTRNLGQEVADGLWESLANDGIWQGEVNSFRKNHEPLYAWINIGVVPDSVNTMGQFVVIVSDVTAMREAQEKLTRLSYYDGLTNLPNRNLFMDRLDLALAKAQRNQQKVAILFIDLDHFKRINDTLGHQIGDIMLRQVARRLKSQLRATDTLCRIGGDEFIIIIEEFKARKDLAVLADKLLSTLDQPLLLGSTEVIPSGSIGISVYPANTEDRDDLIKMADTAMYSAKKSGRRRYTFYQPKMTAQTAHYLYRERELRHAIQHREFVMHYQPLYNAENSEIVGLEALIRWQHPDMGLVAAAEIIPIAEMSNLIIDIGSWVIDEVCRQYGEWFKTTRKPMRIAVNVSPRQLSESRFASIVAGALERHGIPAECLELEITESCLQNNEIGIRCLRELERLGVTISIDDFGTGYSCLSSLKSLPINRLKIDRAFVSDIPENKSDCAIASAIIALGKQLNLSVIAEGIETREQADFMRHEGCNELQGYLFSKPVGALEVETLLSPDQTKIGPPRAG